MHQRSQQRVAFTLIELLIVVGIIAVLAAIAVPNFLEAQTRSKVSRVQNDMRALDTAIQAYGIDYNRYPPTTGTFSQSFEERLIPLTTPVAYITTLPSDPFTRLTGAGGGWTGALAPGDRDDMYGYNTGAGSLGLGNPGAAHDEQMKWSLTSGGPDGLINFPYYAFGPTWERNQRYLVFVYDPTNGTVSNGDIFRRGGRIPNALQGIN